MLKPNGKAGVLFPNPFAIEDGHKSIGKGGFDAAIRDLRQGGGSVLRRQRTQSRPRPLSRIFIQ